MDFEFTSEQTQLSDAVRRFIEKDYGFATRSNIVATQAGTSDAVWKQLVDLGLTALPLPEEQGGFGGTAVDMLLVMTELGRGLMAEPYFATVFAAEFIKRAGNASQKVLLERVADGSAKLAAALAERESRFDLLDVATTAAASDGGFVLSGRKAVVPYGAQADMLVVSARTSPASASDSALSLFIIDAHAKGVAIRDFRSLDGTRVAEIEFENVALGADALLGELGGAAPVIDAVADYGVALLCAEAVGAMEALNAATLEYAKTRRQFGQPIARFQVLQHRMVEMFMHLEQARSMAYLAAVKVDSADLGERRRAASSAKVRIGQAARYIGQQAVQIHGGMGVTNELPAAHLFKRLTMIELTLGDSDHHLAHFVAESRAQNESSEKAEPVRLQEAA